MKKHFVFSFLFVFAAAVTIQAQSLTYSGATTPTDVVDYVRGAAGKLPDVFNSRGSDDDRGRCDCGKYQKQKKGKKHQGCKQRGNHYGKHKKHHKHSCSCDNHCCQNNNRRDRDDDDCGYGRNRRDRDDDDRRYGSTRRDRDERDYPRTGQGNPPVKVSKPAPSTKPTPKRPVAKRKEIPRPVGTRS